MDFTTLYKTQLHLALNSNDTSVLYTSTRRQAAVNEGLQEFADLTECYVRRSTLAISCNTTEVVLSTIADFSRPSKDGLSEFWLTSSGSSATTQIQAGDDFVRRDELWLNRYQTGWRQSTTPGTPNAYYLRPDGGQWLVGFNIRPDVGSSEVAVLRVPYVARPVAMTASTSVPFTDASGNTRHDLTPYHQALVEYAAYKLLPLIGDMQGAGTCFQKFLAYVERFKQAMRPKGGTHITMARSYLSEARRRV
jgi:hypothetical protein